MTGPAANPPRTGTIAFHTLIDDALRHAAAVRETPAHSLAMGVFPDQIIDYVRGELSLDAREEMTTALATVPWAMGRVVALVKARRSPTSLGAMILATTGKICPYDWGVPNTGDEDADLAALLDRV